MGSRRREGSPYLLVLATPTMFWIILSGALHNFNLTALAAFSMPYLMRYHDAALTTAGRLLTLLALAGIPGLLLGGFAGDLARRTRSNGRLLVAALALLLSTPFTYLALSARPAICWASPSSWRSATGSYTSITRRFTQPFTT